MDSTLSKILELSKNKYPSDADFEKALNVKPKTIFNWKRETSKTYYQMLPLICSLLSVSSDYLLGIEKTDGKYVNIPNDSLIALIENMTPESRQKLENFVKNDFRFDLKE